jgi:two-component sensor histidine kinase
MVHYRAPEGKVVIRWSLDTIETNARCLRLSWKERGGPVVTAPARKGFGLAVIERIVAEALNGAVSVDFAPDGLRPHLHTRHTNDPHRL